MIAAGAVSAALAAPCRAQIVFEDVSKAAGIQPYSVAQNGMGGGIAAADFDDDGDIDFFVPNAFGVADQLYRNTGDGQFEEIAAEAGVASTASNRCALWLDYDGDHALDLLVAGDCWHTINNCSGGTSLRLYRQYAPGLFDDVTLGAGLYGQWATPDATHAAGLQPRRPQRRRLDRHAGPAHPAGGVGPLPQGPHALPGRSRRRGQRGFRGLRGPARQLGPIKDPKRRGYFDRSRCIMFLGSPDPWERR